MSKKLASQWVRNFKRDMKAKTKLRDSLMKGLGMSMEAASAQVWPEPENEHDIQVTRKEPKP